MTSRKRLGRTPLGGTPLPRPRREAAPTARPRARTRTECIDHEDAERLAAGMALSWEAGGLSVGTWLNHASALVALQAADTALRRMDYIGIDGILLKRILRCPT